jgi:hypothetical protein
LCLGNRRMAAMTPGSITVSPAANDHNYLVASAEWE